MARVAIIVDQMFEDAELRIPHDRLKQAGHEIDLVGIEAGTQLHGKRGEEHVRTDKAARDVSADQYDALVIPGGYSPDHLRTSLDMVRLTRDMVLANKPVAVVCHGPWMLVEADVVDERVVTSWPSIRTDLLNAGARWVDREVVEDGNLITSRKPGDLEAFSRALLRQLERGVAERMESRSGEPRPTMH
jgi:protease I